MSSKGTFGLFNNHPIPGQSLTRVPGSSPTSRPPQFANPNEALEWLWGVLTSPRMATRLILILKKGTSAEYIARAILFQGFMGGKWTPDVALLMLKLTMAMIISIAKFKHIKVTIFNEDKDQKKFLDNFLDMAQSPDDSISGAGTSSGSGTSASASFSGLMGGL